MAKLTKIDKAKVIKHLHKDMKEEKSEIADDKKMMKTLVSKLAKKTKKK